MFSCCLDLIILLSLVLVTEWLCGESKHALPLCLPSTDVKTANWPFCGVAFRHRKLYKSGREHSWASVVSSQLLFPKGHHTSLHKRWAGPEICAVYNTIIFSGHSFYGCCGWWLTLSSRMRQTGQKNTLPPFLFVYPSPVCFTFSGTTMCVHSKTCALGTACSAFLVVK